jgi:hypothetical protein
MTPPTALRPIERWTPATDPPHTGSGPLRGGFGERGPGSGSNLGTGPRAILDGRPSHYVIGLNAPLLPATAMTVAVHTWRRPLAFHAQATLAAGPGRSYLPLVADVGMPRVAPTPVACSRAPSSGECGRRRPGSDHLRRRRFFRPDGQYTPAVGPTWQRLREEAHRVPNGRPGT